MISNLRNVAIIAHVDHGKTTLIDQLLRQSHTLDDRTVLPERAMDANDLEKERGITILAKNTAIRWKDYRINIVDTPGHADFGGEVERVLSMVDSVLLLVDAVEGPMPQTRFVTQKAFEKGLKPIVVINKIDRPSARPDWVIDQVFDLFDHLGATDEQLDFQVVYASGLQGFASLDPASLGDDMQPLLQTIIDQVPPPPVNLDGPLQLQISALDYSSYVGGIGIGRIARGHLKTNMPVKIIDREGKIRTGKVLQVMTYLGLDRIQVDEAQAGDIVAINGIEGLGISDTICAPDHVEALTALSVDEPTVSMMFQINTSPFVGKEGKFVTSRQIYERLQRELIHNVALRVEQTDDPNCFCVSGRGEMHLGVLIETMRREGFEFAISRPQVVMKEIDGEQCEPYELLTVNVDEEFQGPVIEVLGSRGGDMKNMQAEEQGRVRMDYEIPARGLIGLRTDFLSLTSGTGLMYHSFLHFGPRSRAEFKVRANGVLISNCAGTALAYALWNLQDRGRLFIGPQTGVYEGMIVGLHSRDNDLVVNTTKAKQLTNIRAAGSDENILLTPPQRFTLEQAIGFIADDELVEVTPQSIRLRKKFLKEHERRRASRG